MQTLQVGPFLLNMQIVLYVLFGLGGILAVRYKFRGTPNKAAIVSTAENAWLIWLLVWKGSVLLFDPISVMRYPLSLLYFTAGEKGIWLAWVVSLIYVGYRIRKKLPSLLEATVGGSIFVSAGWLMYSIVQLLLQDTRYLQFGLQIILSAVCLWPLLLTKSPLRWNRLAIYALWFMFGQAGILFMDRERELFLFSFSKEQVLLLIAASVVLMVQGKLSSSSEGTQGDSLWKM